MIPPPVIGVVGQIGAGKTSVQVLLSYMILFCPYCPKCKIVQYDQVPMPGPNGEPPAKPWVGICQRCGDVCLDNLWSLGMRCWSNTPMAFAEYQPMIAEWMMHKALKEGSGVQFGIVDIDEQQAETNRMRAQSNRNIAWIGGIEQIRKHNLTPIWSANTEGLRVPWEQVMATQIAVHVDAPVDAEGRYCTIRMWDRYGRQTGKPTNNPYVLIPDRDPDRTIHLRNLHLIWPMFDTLKVIRSSVQVDAERKAAKEEQSRMPLIGAESVILAGEHLSASEQAVAMQVGQIFGTIPAGGRPYKSFVKRFDSIQDGAALMKGEMRRRGFELRKVKGEQWVVPKEKQE